MNSSAFSKSKNLKAGVAFAAILVIAAAMRIFFLTLRGFEIFNSDHAVVGLMAKHILEGKPMIYYYGQGYMGSLEAFAAAALFILGGMNLTLLQCAPLMFYLLFLMVHYHFTKKVFGFSVSLWSCLLLAVSPPALSVLSITALGGYPEVLFFGTLSLYGLYLAENSAYKKRILFFTGIAAGIGFWVNNLIMMYFLAAGWFYLLRSSFWARVRPQLNYKKVIFLKDLGIPVWLRWALLGLNAWILFFILWQIVSFFLGPEYVIKIASWSFKTAQPIFQVKKLKILLLWLALEAGIVALSQWKIKGCFDFLLKSLPLAAGFSLGACLLIYDAFFLGDGYRVIHASGLIYMKDIPRQWDQVIWHGVLEQVLALPVSWGTAGFFKSALVFIGGLTLGAAFIAYAGKYREALFKAFKFEAGIKDFGVFFFMLAMVVISICFTNTLQSSRYLLPLYHSVPVMIALGLGEIQRNRKRLAFLILAALIFFNAAAVWGWMKENPSRDYLRKDYESVIRFFEENKILAGYADYWISYEINFLSKERVILAPLEHSDDRYPAYTKFANSQSSVAYVFRSSDSRKEAFLKNLQQTYGDCKIYKQGSLEVYWIQRSLLPSDPS